MHRMSDKRSQRRISNGNAGYATTQLHKLLELLVSCIPEKVS
jgi:hypothetical protein